jgi:hypothetical protein
VQFVLLDFTVFEVLEDPLYEYNKLETSNCNSRHNEPRKNIVQQRDISWCNNWHVEYLALLRLVTHGHEADPHARVAEGAELEADGRPLCHASLEGDIIILN